MDKILTWTVRDDDLSSSANGVVNLLLKKCLHLTGREVSRAKFTPEGITADGHPVTICDRLLPGQTLRIVLADSAEVPTKTGDSRIKETQETDAQSRPSVVAVPGTLDILYEDEDVIVLNKPAGKVVHPSHGHWLDSMANHLAAYYQAQGLNGICYAIGRLDKDTSGALLFAKNRPAAARLTAQRGDQLLHRTYLALTEGIPEKTTADIALPMGPDTDSLLRQRIYHEGEPGGRSALTHYTVLESGQLPGTEQTFSLVKLTIDTGRTHQIRLHMAAIGHPLLGDPIYNLKCNCSSTCSSLSSTQNRIPAPAFQRAALHAENISFIQPFTGEQLCIQAPLSEDFNTFLTAAHNTP